MRIAALALRDGDRDELEWLTRSSTVRRVLRSGPGSCCWPRTGCRTPRSPSEGRGVSRPTVISWRARYEQSGMAGSGRSAASGSRRGRSTTARSYRDVDAAAEEARGHALVDPAAGAAVGDQQHTVAQAWRDYGVKPWRSETFKFSTDPELVAKVTDIVGLYLAPPENAIVLCVDEKSQIQALDRTAADAADAARAGRAPDPRLRPARHHDPVRRAGDRHRQGHRGAQARHRHQEFLRLPQAGRPGLPRRSELHLVMDNYAAHKHTRSATGSPRTRGSTSTSPRPPRPG